MAGSSGDESSDSSEEYLVDPSKINLNSSFFTEKPNTSNAGPGNKTDDEYESSDDDMPDALEESNVELFSRVLQNLETSNNSQVAEDESKETLKSDTKRGEAKMEQIDLKSAISNEINELLLKGETSKGAYKEEHDTKEEEREEEDKHPAEYAIPTEGIRITLSEGNVLLRRKKKGQQDVKAILRKQIRTNQLLIEKVSLLCWLAYGFLLNRQANDTEVMSTALSLMSQSNYPKKRIDLSYLSTFTKWFKNIFVIEIKDTVNKLDKETLLKRLRDKKILDYRELVLLYTATLRALGQNCRLVVSLCPPVKKMPEELLSTSETQKAKSETVKSKSKTSGKSSKSKKVDPNEKSSIPENSAEAKKNANEEAKKRAAEILRTQPKSKKRPKIKADDKNAEIKEEETEKDKSEEGKITALSLRQLRSKTIKTSKGNTQKSMESDSKVDGKRSKCYREEDSDSEKEFMPKARKRPIRTKPNDASEETVSTSKAVKKNRKLISSDEEEDEANSTRKTEDVWVEVYLESEESWICVNVMDEKVHCIEEVYKKARKPVLYVVAWNSEGLIKDVTRRYCRNWLTITRKKRIDEKWWNETLSSWKERSTLISRAEDEMLLQKELEQPLPKTIGECKGHPLYVLQRHLLKFEGLYPPDCVPLGYLSSGEAIYSRHCVHTLCSRETWLRRARVVKPKQDPYKIVKARPKYDKLSGMKLKDTALELFGEWQTTEYEPPVAKDGIVPRNEYGNVDLFKECMLPKGTVHINLPALNRVARKLNIDCAPAVVGFSFGGMGAVPDFSGFIVCEEYEDTLREAWEAEQIEAVKRAREKREKRVYGNWKRLIHGLLIRERLAAKYEFEMQKKPVLPNKRTKHKTTDTKKSKVS